VTGEWLRRRIWMIWNRRSARLMRTPWQSYADSMLAVARVIDRRDRFEAFAACRMA
jgi:hypothetical protein